MSDRQSFGELFRGKRTLLITLGIVMFAIAVSAYWMTNKPIAKRRRPEPRARLVEASRVTPATHIVTTDLMGTVIASQSIQLASEVGGRVLSRSDQFIPGGYFRKGERILRIEPRDYQLSVRQSESALVQARSGLKTEMGQQAVAKREYQIMGREVPTADRGLVLRKPQLATAKANVNSASALLDKAKLNLERTLVRSPFNAVVGSRNVDVGAQVGAGSPLASLVGTDQYWVKVLVPVDELHWIDIPGQGAVTGSTARIYYSPAWGPGRYRTGRVLRLVPGLESTGRLAELLVAVDDPLQLAVPVDERLPLILNSYVRVKIGGRELKSVVRVPRTAIRDGNKVWIVNGDKTLAIRDVKIEWSGADSVLVSAGLSAGEMLITSDLATPVPGMSVRLADTSEVKGE